MDFLRTTWRREWPTLVPSCSKIFYCNSTMKNSTQKTGSTWWGQCSAKSVVCRMGWKTLASNLWALKLLMSPRTSRLTWKIFGWNSFSEKPCEGGATLCAALIPRLLLLLVQNNSMAASRDSSMLYCWTCFRLCVINDAMYHSFRVLCRRSNVSGVLFVHPTQSTGRPRKNSNSFKLSQSRILIETGKNNQTLPKPTKSCPASFLHPPLPSFLLKAFGDVWVRPFDPPTLALDDHSVLPGAFFLARGGKVQWGPSNPFQSPSNPFQSLKQPRRKSPSHSAKQENTKNCPGNLRKNPRPGTQKPQKGPKPKKRKQTQKTPEKKKKNMKRNRRQWDPLDLELLLLVLLAVLTGSGLS